MDDPLPEQLATVVFPIQSPAIALHLRSIAAIVVEKDSDNTFDTPDIS